MEPYIEEFCKECGQYDGDHMSYCKNGFALPKLEVTEEVVATAENGKQVFIIGYDFAKDMHITFS